MNTEIRNAIIKLFDKHASRSQDWLVSEIRDLGLVDTDGREVVRTIGLMEDAGELQKLDIGVYRLTLKAIEAEAPWLQKCKNYIIKNWLALVALIIALFK